MIATASRIGFDPRLSRRSGTTSVPQSTFVPAGNVFSASGGHAPFSKPPAACAPAATASAAASAASSAPVRTARENLSENEAGAAGPRRAARRCVLGRPDSATIGAPCVLDPHHPSHPVDGASFSEKALRATRRRHPQAALRLGRPRRVRLRLAPIGRPERPALAERREDQRRFLHRELLAVALVRARREREVGELRRPLGALVPTLGIEAERVGPEPRVAVRHPRAHRHQVSLRDHLVAEPIVLGHLPEEAPDRRGTAPPPPPPPPPRRP